MTVKINPKGSFHFTYVAGYPIDASNITESLNRAVDQIVKDAREHYEKMFPENQAAIVIEEPGRIFAESAEIEHGRNKRAGYIVLEVDIGVFFDYVYLPFPVGVK